MCTDPRRDPATIVVVADVADLWALERANATNGRYHVLGATLSPLDGVVSARVSASETAATLEQANEMFRNGRTIDASNLLRERVRTVNQQGSKAKKDIQTGSNPFGGARGAGVIGADLGAASASFDKQTEVLDRAAKGFEPATPTAAPPASTSGEGKFNARNAQADAFDVSQ